MLLLAGSHRTGKSTLAKEFAEKNKDYAFLETSVSAVFKEMGLDPAITYDFATRLSVQERVLEHLAKLYASAEPGKRYVCDRSPVDLLGYIVGDIAGNTVPPELEERVARYIQGCYDLLNKYGSTIVLVQPGITVVAAEGKASLSNSYMEHLNNLMLGFMMDERCQIPRFYLPRRMTDLEERLRAVKGTIGTSNRMASDECSAYIEKGGKLH